MLKKLFIAAIASLSIASTAIAQPAVQKDIALEVKVKESKSSGKIVCRKILGGRNDETDVGKRCRIEKRV